MNLPYNIDHSLLALRNQAVAAAVLWLLGAPVLAAVAGGAIVGSHGFYQRELAQNEYRLERDEGYDPHAVNAAFFKARNPFLWPQRWDFFAPTIAVSVPLAIAYFVG